MPAYSAPMNSPAGNRLRSTTSLFSTTSPLSLVSLLSVSSTTSLFVLSKSELSAELPE